MRQASDMIPADAELALVAWKEQNLLMAGRPVETFGFRVPWEEQLRRGVAWQAQSPDRRWLLVQEAALLQCVDRERSREVGVANRRNWWLVPAGAIHGACVANTAEREREQREQGKIDTE
jgi:hypothetical protein